MLEVVGDVFFVYDVFYCIYGGVVGVILGVGVVYVYFGS